MEPTLGHGKICYLILHSEDPEASAAFYRSVFGWNIRTRGDGRIAFDDGVGQVSGTWTTDGAPVDASFVYIMTDNAARTCERVETQGGVMLERPNPGAQEVTARFRDPSGNVFGVYEDPSLRRSR